MPSLSIVTVVTASSSSEPCGFGGGRRRSPRPPPPPPPPPRRHAAPPAAPPTPAATLRRRQQGRLGACERSLSLYAAIVYAASLMEERRAEWAVHLAGRRDGGDRANAWGDGSEEAARSERARARGRRQFFGRWSVGWRRRRRRGVEWSVVVGASVAASRGLLVEAAHVVAAAPSVRQEQRGQGRGLEREGSSSVAARAAARRRPMARSACAFGVAVGLVVVRRAHPSRSSPRVAPRRPWTPTDFFFRLPSSAPAGGSVGVEGWRGA